MPAARTIYLTLACMILALAQPAAAATVNAIWNTATDVPVTASSYTATGSTVNFTLNFAPPTGTNLTVVNNTELPFISGAFDNLAQGQAVALSYGGVTYNFVAHYYGGTGNDLVLVWANNRVFAWGANGVGQLGDNTLIQHNIPMPVSTAGVLAGKIILSLATGGGHSLALCSDGTLATWGVNNYGQLGDNTSTSQSSVPVAVNTANGVSALFGKTVIAIAAGTYHSLALCSDGTLATWGNNSYGQLGNGSMFLRGPVPVKVLDTSNSALFGKTVTTIAAGSAYSLALCSDGTVVAWGYNGDGQLGNNGTSNSSVPVAVNASNGVSALFGKAVVFIISGGLQNLALCSDGSVAAWGYNSNGQLGDNSTTKRLAPVAVNSTNGVSALYGKTVVSIAAGSNAFGGAGHCLALCSDGNVVAWGANANGQLGDASNTSQKVPVAVNIASAFPAMLGKTVTSLAASGSSSFAQASDGTSVAWGSNNYGQLGDNTTIDRNAAVEVSSSAFAVGEQFGSVVSGSLASHTMALVASPPVPNVTNLAATSITTSSVTLSGMVNANNNDSSVSFDYGMTTAYGTPVSATPATVTGMSATTVSVAVTGLAPGTTYHFRINGMNAAGTTNGRDMTFTTLSLLQGWRQQSFGTTANTGDTADNADFDHDGIPT